MTNLEALITNIELCSEVDGCSTITFPTLKKLSVNDEIKKVSVSYKKICSDVPYPEEVVQNCMQETLNFFYFILTNREDTDFILKDLGTLAIRGTEVTMAFCEDFLLSLNKSTYVVDKLLTKKQVTSDKEVTFSPSRLGHVYQFPQPLPKPAGAEGRQHKDTPLESPESALPPSEKYRQKRELPQETEETLMPPETTSDTGEGLETTEVWIQARRQFRTELESLGDIETWLKKKFTLSSQEERCWERIKSRRADRRAAAKSAVTDSLEHSPPKSSQPQKKRAIPLVCAPYPQALVTLHNLLHKKQLRMVNIFKKAGMDGKKIKRKDFIKVIKETKVPISDKDLEDMVIFLTSSKPGNFTTLKDLAECQKQWLEMRKGQSQDTKTDETKPDASTKPKRKLTHLEVPPVNTEPERRHLSYDEMEEAGKLFRERRRWEKNKDSPIEQKEKCRMVRSGDGPIDEHCLPSTLEADLGELVNQYRRKTVTSYLNCTKLCKDRDIHITERTLQRALLHPGDRIIKEGEDVRKIRQPGGYYGAGLADDASSPASGSQAKEVKD
ncbi:PREDICTED: EF-hand calcium-binding domain-containing protein 12, partial [Tauraco erythrolophus]|uniref:EF-hand calcium-binding domain-containing protein 12 n=1 Tax=Tauraco erythrolophus TaxID=121530 RepID=UPI00052337C6